MFSIVARAYNDGWVFGVEIVSPINMDLISDDGIE